MDDSDAARARRAERAAYMRAWRLKNREACIAKERERYARRKQNPEWVASERARLRQWARDNPEANMKWERENRERSLELHRAWYARNAKRESARTAKWRAENRDRVAAWAVDWRRRNPLNSREYEARRRAWALQAKVYAVTPKDLTRLLSTTCAYCDQPATEIDHVVPLARGGYHGIGNLIGACRKCNRSKSSLLLIEWRVLTGRY